MKAGRDELFELLSSWSVHVIAFSGHSFDRMSLVLFFVHDKAHGHHVAVHGLQAALSLISLAFSATFFVKNKPGEQELRISVSAVKQVRITGAYVG